jgi:hypothetical protein
MPLHNGASNMVDASEYQVVKAGQVHRITELSREDLIGELVKAMDALEELARLVGKGNGVIQRWRFEIRKQGEG